MSSKAALKAAKAALDASDWPGAQVQASKVLDQDPSSYNANVFLGKSLDKQGKLDEAIKAYDKAVKADGSNRLAWQGLIAVFEQQKSGNLQRYQDAALHLAQIFEAADDRTRCQTVVDKFIGYAKGHGSRAQYRKALELILPTSPVYSYLEGRLWHPEITYTRVADIIETEEKETVNKEIGERRTRLGATLTQVTAEVKREVLVKSELEDVYREIINWASDDTVRRRYEEKLLLRAHEILLVLPTAEKTAKRDQVYDLARGMVIIRHDFHLAWSIVLEWHDFARMEDLDSSQLTDYVTLFPSEGLAATLRGYLLSPISPFGSSVRDEILAAGKPKQSGGQSARKLVEDEQEQDPLILVSVGLEEAEASPLAHRLTAECYLYLDEWESAMETSRKGISLLQKQLEDTGLMCIENYEGVNLILATSLVHYQSPRHHPDARHIFEGILQRSPHSAAALAGLALVLREEERYAEASQLLRQALEKDPLNLRLRLDAAWCTYLEGSYDDALTTLKGCLKDVDPSEPKSKELKSLCYYRIGACKWDLLPDPESRASRKGAYQDFLSAIRLDLSNAAAYTALGVFYADYAHDDARARKCFSKAFELAPSEFEAARRLAESFAESQEWDLVEIVAQRVADTGKIRTIPGSRSKAVSWPYSALGVVNLNKPDYSQAVIAFNACLRLAPEDYHALVGLGEAYYHSGRFVAAARCFERAQPLAADSGQDGWFATLMLSNVHRELGEFELAIGEYQEVVQQKPDEVVASLSLLQCFVEHGWSLISGGSFGQASEAAREALKYARSQEAGRSSDFYRHVADACSILATSGGQLTDEDRETITTLLQDVKDPPPEVLDQLEHLQLSEPPESTSPSEPSPQDALRFLLNASIAAFTQSLSLSHPSLQARSIAHYNLAHAHHTAHTLLSLSGPAPPPTAYLRPACRHLKTAIELEARNPTFWSALGVCTSALSPKIAQHALIRALYLDGRDARAWVNLGALYLQAADPELAEEAFARAQSLDPEYGPAWAGMGLVAGRLGQAGERWACFEHAAFVSGPDDVLVKALYSFEMIRRPLRSVGEMLGPALAAKQLRRQVRRPEVQHLDALYAERMGDFEAARETLARLADEAEAAFEESESEGDLRTFVRCKADLARVMLQGTVSQYAAMALHAETALSLLDGTEGSTFDEDERRKISIGCHLAMAVSKLESGNVVEAQAEFDQQLAEIAAADPDLLTLWTRRVFGRPPSPERTDALLSLKEQLLTASASETPNIPLMLLLGTLAASMLADGDIEIVESVVDDLKRYLETSETAADASSLPSLLTREKVARAIGSLRAVLASGQDGEEAMLKVVKSSAEKRVKRLGGDAEAWELLADVLGEEDAGAWKDGSGAEVDLRKKAREVAGERARRWAGGMTAEELAVVYRRGAHSETGDGSWARAKFVAPWL